MFRMWEIFFWKDLQKVVLHVAFQPDTVLRGVPKAGFSCLNKRGLRLTSLSGDKLLDAKLLSLQFGD